MGLLLHAKNLLRRANRFRVIQYYRLCTPKQIGKAASLGEFASSDAEYILNYTNNVLKLSRGGEEFFFKEARLRAPLREYMLSCVDDFFAFYPNDGVKRRVAESLKKRRNVKRVYNMGYRVQEGSPFNRYVLTGDETVLGLPPFEGEEKELVKKLVFFLYGAVTNYDYNMGVKRGRRQTFLAVRSLAVEEIAGMLGLSFMIPRAVYGELLLDGREKAGVLTAKAAGVNASEIPPAARQKGVTPSLLKALTDLNFLDAVCSDNDHRVDNYFTLTDGEGNFIGVVSYDNDGPSVFGLSDRPDQRHSLRCSPLIRGGKINRAHMDRGLAERLLAIRAGDLKKLSVYLTYAQVRALRKRVECLQRAVRRTAKSDPAFLADNWTEDFVREDLSGKYGKTYLVSFLTDCDCSAGLSPLDVC